MLKDEFGVSVMGLWFFLLLSVIDMYVNLCVREKKGFEIVRIRK